MQRVSWFVIFFIILGVGYYWLFIDQERVSEMTVLSQNDETLTGDVNTVEELERRLELRYIGHGKHLQSIQDEYHAHYQEYITKMDSIDMVLEEIKFSMEQMKDQLIKKIDRNKDDLETLSDSFESFKRKTNRSFREIQLDVSTIKDDIKAINEKLAEDKKKK